VSSSGRRVRGITRERFVRNGHAGSDYYGERGARTYNGVCARVQGQSPLSGGQGAKPPEADDILLIQIPYFAFNYIDESVTLSN